MYLRIRLFFNLSSAIFMIPCYLRVTSFTCLIKPCNDMTHAVSCPFSACLKDSLVFGWCVFKDHTPKTILVVRYWHIRFNSSSCWFVDVYPIPMIPRHHCFIIWCIIMLFSSLFCKTNYSGHFFLLIKMVFIEFANLK